MLMYIYYAVVLILSVASYIYSTKQNQDSSIVSDDFEATTADEGKTIPVVFGTCWLGQNVVWYGHVDTEAVQSKGGKK